MTKAEHQRNWRRDHREEYLQQCRERYAERRRRQVCNQCGKPAGQMSVCRECLEKRRKS